MASRATTNRRENIMSKLHTGGTSVVLVISYIFDWIVIIGILAVGYAFSSVSPKRRAFDITNPDISYPLVKETISSSLLLLLSVLLPAAVVVLVSLFLGLGPRRGSLKPSKFTLIRRKLWEWHAGWLGLGVALALTFAITSGLKEVVGKPRPNFLARCQPDTSKKLTAEVGGIGDMIEEGIKLYDWRICRVEGKELNEHYRSFPSGHASTSFAGLTYLALWICAKFGIAIPLLSRRNIGRMASEHDEHLPQRSQAAAPPTYLLLVPLIPIGLALYIAGTRYSDYWHHGVDVVAGAILGVVTAWIGFRWYHLPISRGGGWAWAPRSSNRAFGKGIGVEGYADVDAIVTKRRDLEAGEMDRFSQRPPSQDTASDHGRENIELNNIRQPRNFLDVPERSHSHSPNRSNR